MTARAYRPVDGGRVIRVAAGSLLEAMVANSGAYVLDEAELVDGAAGADDQPPAGETTSPAGEPATVPAATLPPVPPATPAPAAPPPATPAPAVELDPAAAAILAAAYETDTAEGVNSYLDDHPYAAELVLDYERANKARKGILTGRHGTPADPAAE